MKVLQILLATLRAIVIIVSMILCILPYFVLSSILFSNTPERAFKLRRLWIAFGQWIMGIKVEYEGQVPKESALYVCNHRTFSDPIVISKYIDAYVIAKAEVADLPLIHTGAKLTGIIYVQRQNQDSRNAVRAEMVKTIKDGYNVLVFPEGTTNPEKKLMPYSPGTFMEAGQNNIAVVPVVLEYKDYEDLWYSRGLISQFYRQCGKWHTHTKLSFGTPVRHQDGQILRDQVHQWSQAKIDEMHEDWDSYFSKSNGLG